MFENLGQLGGLMKQISEIKGNMTKMKQQLLETVFTGKDPDEKVIVEISGNLQVKSVHVDPSLMKSGNSAAVEAAVNIAFTDALKQFRETSAKMLSEATGGINIPGLS